MQKLNKKTITKPVGANYVRQNSKGITLIALIITIIVMIILVGVTVNVALNGGLFKAAQDAAENTIAERDRELDLSTGEIIDEWITGWKETEKPAEWDNEKVIAVTDGENTIPLPEGYEISSDPEENTIEKGVVIKDSKGNEFVWIPVSEDFTETYSDGTDFLEPTELTDDYPSSGAAYDSQATLDYLYGEGYYDYPETEEEKLNVENSFAYKAHYAEMVESVNKYNGFYIGRYETTIDGSNQIGSVANTTVLTSNKSIPQTNNKQCRWYGLYYTQRNSNVIGNKDYIQTNMIWGQQWDAMIKHFKNKSIDYSVWGKSTQGRIVNSGQSTNESGAKDKIYNIYDLRTNGDEWTAEGHYNYRRISRGGNYFSGDSAGISTSFGNPSTLVISTSRLTLYIK